MASRNEVPFLEAVKSALQQAVQSYAPYSHCPSSLAIVTAQGTVYSGPYLESAAFNPSLGPLQAAVIDAVTDGIAYYTEVGFAVAMSADAFSLSALSREVHCLQCINFSLHGKNHSWETGSCNEADCNMCICCVQHMMLCASLLDLLDVNCCNLFTSLTSNTFLFVMHHLNSGLAKLRQPEGSLLPNGACVATPC